MSEEDDMLRIADQRTVSSRAGRTQQRWPLLVLLISAACACMEVALAGSLPGRMRAAHMGGNYGGNQQGIKRLGANPLKDAPGIVASQVFVDVTRGSFVDGNGRTIASDKAIVRLKDVSLSSGTTFAQAGFSVTRNVETGALAIKFSPAFDPSLAGIPGFPRDVYVLVSKDGLAVDTLVAWQATGPALELVKAVLAHGAELVQAANVNLFAPATFDQASIATTFIWLNSNLAAGLDPYFAYLKDLNVEWLGISVALTYEGMDDPTVRIKYRPPGDTSWTIYTFDDEDLEALIAKARANGLKVYLTTAFEPSSVPLTAAEPTCRTPQYRVARYELGNPRWDPNDPSLACVNQADWWWDPTHPQHAANVSQFWSTYTAAVKKYAELAQRTGVELYSLGTETDRLFRSRAGYAPFTNHFLPQLKYMVAQVRSVYTGLVTYDQHSRGLTDGWFGGAEKDLAADLGFDVIGISAYFQLTASPPTAVLPVNVLEAEWETVFSNHLMPLQAANPGRPIVFTEFGATDSLRSPFQADSQNLEDEPLRDATGVTDGMRQQRNLLQAFFNVNERHGNLVRGAFIWGTEIFLEASWMCDKITLTVWCKPATAAVKDAYGRWKEIGGGTVGANPYGAFSVQGGSVAGNSIYNLQPNAVIQLGNIPGNAGSVLEIDMDGFELGSSNTLTLRSGAPGQSVVIRDRYTRPSFVEGRLQAVAGGGGNAPSLHVYNPHGIVVRQGGTISGPASLMVDALDTTVPRGGGEIINHGTLDGGPSLSLLGARITGGGAFKGNALLIQSFGHANNPVRGNHFLENGLALQPSSGTQVALSISLYGTVPQVLNLSIAGNASLWMPSAWPASTGFPQNNAVVPLGGSRPAGVAEPSYGGGSMIVQATGTLALFRGPTSDFVFPGAIALKAGDTLDLNGVVINQGWTNTGKQFQGVFFESPNIVSPTLIQVLTNNPNWINFSTIPKQKVRTWSLAPAPSGGAAYVVADSFTPHINTYSATIEAAANGQCWVCLINTTPVDLY